MKQFILRETPGRNRTVRLDGDDYHYLVRVRRLKPGDSFPALLPGGVLGTVSVLSTEGGILSGRVSVREEVSVQEGVPAALPSALPPLVLFQALPKGTKIDLIVRQAAEGALSEVVVFLSERSVARAGKPEDKEERWRRIVKEARQQSGSPVETAIRFRPSLDAALFRWAAFKKQYRNPLGLLLHQYPLEKETFHDYLDTSPDLLVLAAGPEGGFSAAEVTGFLEAGFKAVRIGDTVLRSETAALYGAAAARIILLERSAWMLKEK
ncbi:MAG: 16S rRNA (uracil(1498)-N(3))-methyltransferase [Treponema sp.]|nr:16S rRNA (uracil(1498)-N(3))-methyltransferase [Treponema sp.]